MKKITLSACLLSVFTGCGGASVAISMSSDRPCSDFGGASITVSRTGNLDGTPPLLITKVCEPNGTGSKFGGVIVGADDNSELLQIKAVMAVKPADIEASCTEAGSSGCQVARRDVRFINNKQLGLNIKFEP